MSLPIIAIIGRPNVGKSTLFNRLVGARIAITSPEPGTTRDRVYHETLLGTWHSMLVDTAGIEFDKKRSIEADMQSQARIAISEADIILFVVDATGPLTSSDLDAARYLRPHSKKIILIAHKADNLKVLQHMDELVRLGFEEPLAVSSVHNRGIIEIEDRVARMLRKMKWRRERVKKKNTTYIAIVGKPNVGKSSLVNALLGDTRLIVSDTPGTTIDSTDSPLKHQGNDFVLIDTAGIRRRGKIAQGIEKYGFLRSLTSIARSDVVCLTIDYDEGLANQDLHVSNYILDAGKGVIVVVNKADLMEDPEKERKKFLNLMHYRMSFMPWAPVIFVSALERKNIFKIFELARAIAEEREKKISDALFKIFLRATIDAHPPQRSGQNLRIMGGLQSGVNPPTFTFRVNKPDLIHFSYKRFLENEIRRKFGFYGTPLQLEFMSLN